MKSKEKNQNYNRIEEKEMQEDCDRKMLYTDTDRYTLL